MRRLATYLCRRFGIPQVVSPDGIIYSSLGQITGGGYGILRHRNLRPTACPGKFPMEALATPLDEGGAGRLSTWEIAALAAAGAAAVWLWMQRRRA